MNAADDDCQPFGMGQIRQFEETGVPISLHGLGFVQVELQGKQRLHVWHPDLPRRACHEHSQIHDHRFGFISRVLVGEQANVTYAALPLSAHGVKPTHVAYLHEGPRTAHGNRPWVPDGKLFLYAIARETVRPGESYRMLPYVYHATVPSGDAAVGGGRVATIMTKTSEGDRGAHSLCRVGIAPDVDFDRFQWPEADLWRVVADVLGNHP